MNHNKHRSPRKENDRRPTLPEWLAVKLDIPADAAGDGLRLDMRGRHTLLVHNINISDILYHLEREMNRPFFSRTAQKNNRPNLFPCQKHYCPFFHTTIFFSDIICKKSQ